MDKKTTDTIAPVLASLDIVVGLFFYYGGDKMFGAILFYVGFVILAFWLSWRLFPDP